MTEFEKTLFFQAITRAPEEFNKFYTAFLYLEAKKHLTNEEKKDKELLAWVKHEAGEIAGEEIYFYTQTDEGREYTKTQEDFCNSLTPKRDGRTIAKWGKSDTKYFRKHTAPDGTII